MYPKVLIIILNWNGKIDTVECIDSLKKNTYTNYQIVIIDNGSNDDSVDNFKQLFPRIMIIQNKNNLGFTGGNNIGIKYGLENGFDYILLLNNDVIVDPAFLDKLVDVAISDDKIGILAPMVLYYHKRNVIQSAGLRVNKYGVKSDNIGYNEIDNGQYQISDRDFVSGTAMLINRCVLEAVGGFDPKYFAYWEDMDLCIRTKKAGFKIGFVPGSKVWHKGSASTGGYLNRTAYYYHIRNSIYYFHKNYSMYNFASFFIFLSTAYFFMLFGYSIVKNRMDLIIAYFMGIKDAIYMVL